MAKHEATVIWLTRDPYKYPDKPYQLIRTEDEKTLAVVFFPGSKGSGIVHHLSRSDARMLIRRLTQCLDSTAGGSK